VNPDLDILYAAFFLLFGLCFGSFATAMIHREINGQSWFDLKGAAARSFCPHCRHTLTAMDMVPVLSWLLLRGKCRYCSHPVSIYYPLIELACGMLTLLAFFVWDVSAAAFTAVLCIPFLIAGFYVWCATGRLTARLFVIPAVLTEASVFLHIFVLN